MTVKSKEAEKNVLEQMLYADRPVQITRKRFDRGIFISITNHRQGNDDLVASLKEQYKSIVYALTGVNISKEGIKVTDKLPKQQVLTDCLVAGKVFLAAGFHCYSPYNQRTGRGSSSNYGGYHHLHFYVYGVQHLMENHQGGCEEAARHIKHCLFRHNNFKTRGNPSDIDLREVGVGKYQYGDVVTPTTLHQYLSLPTTNPEKECCINYIAGTKHSDSLNPIIYVYQRGN